MLHACYAELHARENAPYSNILNILLQDSRNVHHRRVGSRILQLAILIQVSARPKGGMHSLPRVVLGSMSDAFVVLVSTARAIVIIEVLHAENLATFLGLAGLWHWLVDRAHLEARRAVVTTSGLPALFIAFEAVRMSVGLLFVLDPGTKIFLEQVDGSELCAFHGNTVELGVQGGQDAAFAATGRTIALALNAHEHDILAVSVVGWMLSAQISRYGSNHGNLEDATNQIAPENSPLLVSTLRLAQ